MRGNVMVVDDDADIRETLADVLELSGFHVTLAADAEDAMAQLRAGERPGLILLDLMMPRVSGEDFRRWQLADESLATIPVVVLSGARGVETVARQLGAEVLPKPVELSHLTATVARLCAPATGAPDAR